MLLYGGTMEHFIEDLNESAETDNGDARTKNGYLGK